MRNGYLVLLAAVLVAVWRLAPPAPLPPEAPPQVFSAGRALADIRPIAWAAHPIGSPEHGRVRAYLVARLEKMGLAPEVHADRALSDYGNGRVTVAPVANVIGILPGKDRKAPAVLVMSHYDSVPNSPGAADDTTGVAVALEVARAFQAGPPPPRDVIFLFTDGEELGLLGATAFFAHDPLASRVGAVLNMDARGDSGNAWMFESGLRDRETVAAYAGAVRRPAADSLSRLVYSKMPNGSDFTLALNRGLPGMNFGFIGDEAAYHSALSTPAHLDLGSVQHMGDSVLASARAFAAAIPAQTDDVVFFDVLGLFVVHYSFVTGWLLLVAAAALTAFAVWKAARAAGYAWWRGAAGVVLAVAAPSLLLWGAGYALAGIDHFQRLAHFDFLLAGAAIMTVGAAAGMLALLDRGQRPAATWIVGLVLLLVLAAITQAVCAEAAFIFTWPCLLTAAAAALQAVLPRRHWAGTTATVLVALLLGAQIMAYGAQLFLGVGVDLPVILILPLLILLPAVLLVPGDGRLPAFVHGAVLLAGIAVFAYGRWAPPTPERPAPSMVRYVLDQDSGKAYRVAYFLPLDSWERAALKDGTAPPRLATLPWTDGKRLWWVPVRPAAVAASGLTVTRQASRLTVKVSLPPGVYSAVLSVRSPQPLRRANLDGTGLKAAFRPGVWNDVRFFAPNQDGFSWSVEAPKTGALELRLITTMLAWPEGAPPLPPLPEERMAFGTSGGTQTVLQRTVRW